MKSRTKPALRVVKPAARVAPVELPVQMSLNVAGVLADVKHAFYGLCLAAGKQVLAAMMEADRQALCGPAHVPDAARRAVRGGSTPCSVVLGGQRIGITRPRVRGLEGAELALPSYEWAANTDPLDAATLSAIAAGVSTRRYAGTLDPLPPTERSSSASKSAVSRRWVAMTGAQLDAWQSRSLGELDLPVVMIDGIHLDERVILIALGIDAQGIKHVLGLHEGSTEATGVVRSLLSDLVARGLDAERPRLWVIDGGKALRRAIVECFGKLALIQRCQEHKRRNVIEHLPKHMHVSVNKTLRDAWSCADAELAAKQLQRLAARLNAEHPGAAASVLEGLEDTLTVQRLGLGSGALAKTLRTTNPIENLNGSVGRFTRNVKRWKDGQMVLRWIAGALDDAKLRFRKLRGHRDMPKLLAALELPFLKAKQADRKVA